MSRLVATNVNSDSTSPHYRQPGSTGMNVDRQSESSFLNSLDHDHANNQLTKTCSRISRSITKSFYDIVPVKQRLVLRQLNKDPLTHT